MLSLGSQSMAPSIWLFMFLFLVGLFWVGCWQENCWHLRGTICGIYSEYVNKGTCVFFFLFEGSDEKKWVSITFCELMNSLVGRAKRINNLNEGTT